MHSAINLMHKTASPNTYPCKLCSLTYNGAFMNRLWKRYIAHLGLPAIFMHRDDFSKAYPDQNISYPVVILNSGSSFRTLISREEFESIKDLESLMKELAAKLEEATPVNQYECPECGLHYEDESTMKKCEAWCRKNKSCNLEIIKESVEKKNIRF